MPTYDLNGPAGIGYSVAYAEFATDVSIAATTEATANLIVTAPTFTPNARDSFWIEFFCPSVTCASLAAAEVRIVLYDNGVSISAGAATIGQVVNNAAAAYATPVYCKVLRNPTAVAHSFSIRAYNVTGTGTVKGTNGGIGRPGWMNITVAT